VNQIRLFIKKNNSNELFIHKLDIISSWTFCSSHTWFRLYRWPL